MIELMLLIAMLVSLAAAAFCAGTETGFLSVSRGRILHMARLGGKHAKIVQRALADLPRTMTALLVGNNLAAVSYSSSSAALSALLFADSQTAQALWAAAAAFAMLAAGEFVPKFVCSMRPLNRTLALAPSWNVARRILIPISSVVQVAVSRLLPRKEQPQRMTPENVMKILEDRKDGVKLSDFESALIGRLMVLRARGRFITPDSLLAALDSVD